MNRTPLAIGLISNYLRCRKVQEALSSYLKNGYALTFFHPLRILASMRKPPSKLCLNRKLELESYLGEFAGEVLRRDVESFFERLKLFKSMLTGHTGLLRIVLHTEYSIPLWCNEIFRELYLGLIPDLIKQVEVNLRGFNYEIVVELHPGFTDLKSCEVLWNGNLVRVDRKNKSCIERNPRKLEKCMHNFMEDAVAKTEKEKLRFCIEPRAGSAVHINEEYQSQTLDDHYRVAVFAEKLSKFDTSIVLDPGQTNRARISEQDVWNELLDVGEYYADMVEEIHVHSIVCQAGSLKKKARHHAPPNRDELDMFAKLIHKILERRRKPVGIVYEVVGGKLDRLVKDIDYLLKGLASTTLW